MLNGYLAFLHPNTSSNLIENSYPEHQHCYAHKMNRIPLLDFLLRWFLNIISINFLVNSNPSVWFYSGSLTEICQFYQAISMIRVTSRALKGPHLKPNTLRALNSADAVLGLHLSPTYKSKRNISLVSHYFPFPITNPNFPLRRLEAENFSLLRLRNLGRS